VFLQKTVPLVMSPTALAATSHSFFVRLEITGADLAS
jgi:hypothetical protein